MVSFSSLKSNYADTRKRVDQELEKMSKGSENRTDDRFWRCTLDKAGNGTAVIRFLPPPPQDGEEGVPFVRIYSHGFKGPGGWYIENSLTTHGQADPVAEMNSVLWNEGENSPGRLRVKGSGKDNPGTKRQENYYSNILVVSDPSNPENEGKVFLFKYGKMIYEKLLEARMPADPDEPKIDPFDPWSGANFKLIIRKNEGYSKPDKSKFLTPSPISEDDDEIEAIWKKQYSLKELLAPANFKSYEQLKQRLDRVLNGSAPSTQKPDLERQAAASRSPIANAPGNDEGEDDDLPWAKPAIKQSAPTTSIAPDSDDDEATLEFFKNIGKKSG